MRLNARSPRVHLIAAAAATAFVAPPPAQAHIRSGIVALDHRVTVERFPHRAIRAWVHAGDGALELVVARGHRVSVRTTPGARPVRIEARSGRRSVVFHDPRLRGLPAGVQDARWAVEVVVNGESGRLQGRISRVPAPGSGPWIGLSLACAVALAVVLAGPRRRLPTACVAFAGLAAVATIAIAVGFGASRTASTGRILEAFDVLLAVLVGLAIMVKGREDRRLMAGVALGLLGLVAGGLKVAALHHGVVLSALPADAARASVVLALSAGAAAVVVGARVLTSR